MKLRKKITTHYLENSGAYYLQRFAASTAQFRKVMRRKIDLSCRDHPEQNKEECYTILDELVLKFSGLGYLNDNAYAGGLVYSLTQRGFSRQRILYTLKLKGLPDECIEEVMPDADPEREFMMAVRFCKKKKIGPFSTREDDESRSLSALARGGFSYDLARRAVDLDKKEAEELLEKL